MKLSLCISLVCATVSFGQAPIRVHGPFGTVYLKAAIISGLDDGVVLRNVQLPVIRRRLASLKKKYPEGHAEIQELQSLLEKVEMDVLSDAKIVELKGDVEIKTDTVIVTADAADYHLDTGEIEPRGNVHIKPNPTQIGPLKISN